MTSGSILAALNAALTPHLREPSPVIELPELWTGSTLVAVLMSVAGPVLNGSSVSSGLWGTDLGGKAEGSRICQGRYAEQGCRAGLRVGGGGRAGLQGVVGESEPGCRAGLRVGGWEWVQRREGRAGLQSENGVGAGQGGSAERGCREVWASGGMQRGEAERGCREWGGGRAGLQSEAAEQGRRVEEARGSRS